MFKLLLPITLLASLTLAGNVFAEDIPPPTKDRSNFCAPRIVALFKVKNFSADELAVATKKFTNAGAVALSWQYFYEKDAFRFRDLPTAMKVLTAKNNAEAKIIAFSWLKMNEKERDAATQAAAECYTEFSDLPMAYPK